MIRIHAMSFQYGSVILYIYVYLLVKSIYNRHFTNFQQLFYEPENYIRARESSRLACRCLQCLCCRRRRPCNRRFHYRSTRIYKYNKYLYIIMCMCAYISSSGVSRFGLILLTIPYLSRRSRLHFPHAPVPPSRAVCAAKEIIIIKKIKISK